MIITCYADLLEAANAQAQPQRLLFTFTKAELPNDAAPSERQRYAARQGGALAPVACVDKDPALLGSFEQLVEESRATGAQWDVVFVTSLSGSAGQPPAEAAADAALRTMVAAVRNGHLERLLAFSREGELLKFQHEK